MPYKRYGGFPKKSMIKKTTYMFLACLLLLASCEDYYDTKNNPVTYGDTYLNIGILPIKQHIARGRPYILLSKRGLPVT